MIDNDFLPPLLSDESSVMAEQRNTNQQTAKRALRVARDKYGKRLVTEFDNQFRNRLAAAFALDGKIIYGRAFDAIICNVDLNPTDLDVESIFQNIKHITLCEIKSTTRNVPQFKGYFFSISTAEVLVAQSLREQFKFIFVNVNSQEIVECSLIDIYANARAIYPTWSITLTGLDPTKIAKDS